MGNDGVAPGIRNLAGLTEEVKNEGKGRGYVGTHGFNGFGKKPTRAGSLIGFESFEVSLCF